MMKEEKGNIEQMSERLFHYLRKRESSASQEAEDVHSYNVDLFSGGAQDGRSIFPSIAGLYR